jgi:hypothetical protein
VFIPAFALRRSYFKLFCLFAFDINGMEGAYPDPGLKVEAMEEFGKSGGSILICSS